MGFHLNNDVAKKPDVVRHLANLFWEDIFKCNELVLVGGDVNGGIQAFQEEQEAQGVVLQCS